LFQERKRAAQKQGGGFKGFFVAEPLSKMEKLDYSEELKRQEKRRFLDHALYLTRNRLDAQEGILLSLKETLTTTTELVRKSDSVFAEEVKKKAASKKPTLKRLEAQKSSGLFNEARPSLKHLVKLHVPL
jgi:hypothetical protein